MVWMHIIPKTIQYLTCCGPIMPIMLSQKLFNIDSYNGLLPYGTKS